MGQQRRQVLQPVSVRNDDSHLVSGRAPSRPPLTASLQIRVLTHDLVQREVMVVVGEIDEHAALWW